MRAGMTGHRVHAKVQAHLWQIDRIAIAYLHIDAVDARVVGAITDRLVMGAQCVQATDMVGMMMGDENGAQGATASCKKRLNRCRAARIDDQRAAIGSGYRPDVVVVERGYGVQTEHGNVSLARMGRVAPGAVFAHNSHHARASRCTSNRSEEHTSELPSLMRISYAVFV